MDRLRNHGGSLRAVPGEHYQYWESPVRDLDVTAGLSSENGPMQRIAAQGLRFDCEQ